ncbi:MAG: ABC transporter ATP-binding protein [Micrococcales bacterium]|nr:ABC transporter ATP-binding protein [Micrococcales bacterium]
MAVLELQDVSVTYRSAQGDLPAAREVSLTVDAGRSLGLAGESGSGKTTVTSTVLRLLPKSATVTGRVLLEGEDVLTMKWGRLRAVRWASASVVFQGAMHALNPVQRVGRQIAEPIRLHEKSVSEPTARARVGDLLEQVGLPSRVAQSYPHQLSGGQKQRVMIAMALACGPRLIVADEPTTALDVMVQQQVLDVLTERVRDLGLAMVFISHDLSVLASTCDDLAVMYAGQVVELGPSDQVFEQAHHPYSRALGDAYPRIGDRRFRYSPGGLPGDPPFPGEAPSGCAFHPRCPVARDECATTDVALRPSGDRRWSSCLFAPEVGT